MGDFADQRSIADERAGVQDFDYHLCGSERGSGWPRDVTTESEDVGWAPLRSEGPGAHG